MPLGPSGLPSSERILGGDYRLLRYIPDMQKPFVPGVIAWFDAASAFDGMAEGTPISFAQDYSGVNTGWFQPTAINQPTVTRRNGYIGAYFNAASGPQYLNAGGAISTMVTFFGVWNCRYYNGYSALLSRTGPIAIYSRLNGNGHWGPYHNADQGSGEYAPTTGGLRLGEVRWDAGAGQETVWTNGMRQGPWNFTGSNTTVTNPAILGWDGSANQAHMGSIMEVIVGNTILTNDQHEIIRAYLAAKWNINLGA